MKREDTREKKQTITSNAQYNRQVADIAGAATKQKAFDNADNNRKARQIANEQRSREIRSDRNDFRRDQDRKNADTGAHQIKKGVRMNAKDQAAHKRGMTRAVGDAIGSVFGGIGKAIKPVMVEDLEKEKTDKIAQLESEYQEQISDIAIEKDVPEIAEDELELSKINTELDNIETEERIEEQLMQLNDLVQAQQANNNGFLFI